MNLCLTAVIVIMMAGVRAATVMRGASPASEAVTVPFQMTTTTVAQESVQNVFHK